MTEHIIGISVGGWRASSVAPFIVPEICRMASLALEMRCWGACLTVGVTVVTNHVDIISVGGHWTGSPALFIVKIFYWSTSITLKV